MTKHIEYSQSVKTPGKTSVVVIGAGLAGSVVVDTLDRQKFDITVIAAEENPTVKSSGYKMKLSQSVAGGLGGTTKLWHNALIEIDNRYLDNSWLEKTNTAQFYEEAYLYFGLTARDRRKVQYNCTNAGKIMFIPAARKNLWNGIREKNNVKTILEKVTKINRTHNRITSVTLSSGLKIEADLIVDCSGGLGAIGHLSDYFNLTNGKTCKTSSYEDHLCSYVARITLKNRVNPLAGKIKPGWTYRVPLIGEAKYGKTIAFYLRPSVRPMKRRIKSPRSALNQVRNGPKRMNALAALLFNPSEVIEAINSRFGLIVKSKYFEVFAVFANEPKLGYVEYDSLSYTVRPGLTAELAEHCGNALRSALANSAIHESVSSVTLYKNLLEKLDTGAHHSSTFPMDAAGTYFDYNFKLAGVANYFGISGAIIPDSVYSNTGLTICAMALNLTTRLNIDYDPNNDCGPEFAGRTESRTKIS